jgi:inosine/xanthosine triphosphate pyrophosphatase family protein
LQINDCKHVLYFPTDVEARITSRGPGLKKENSTNFLSDDSKLTMQYLTLHPSDYSKLSPKNVIPYNEFVSYKTTDTITLASTSATIISNQVQ